MQDVFGILLMFTGAASGLLFQDPVVCRFNENSLCYVALGQQLHLQLPLEDRFDLKITDKTSTDRLILKYRKTQSNPPKPNHPKWQFVKDNKTMILTSAERSDSGTYTLETFDANGNDKGSYTLQLNIEDFTLIILSLVCVLLIVLSVLAFYIYKRLGLWKKGQKAPSQDGKELVYADITHLPTNKTETRPTTSQAQDKDMEYATVVTHPSQRNQKKNEEEVQYGNLVFNMPDQKKSVMPKVQEECVYSQVQHGQ